MLSHVLFFLACCEQLLAVPIVTYPFNSQVPPVARVGHQYNYTLPENTFGNGQSSIALSLSGNPSWLSLDTTSRTFYGTPSQADVGFPAFDLIGSDSTGSATDNIVLVVSAKPAPYVAQSLESQLESIGSTDGAGALILAPDTVFDITFSPQTFAETGGNVSAYYGTSDNFTPLPSWIHFDPSLICFTGTAPLVLSAIAPPQYFEFVLVGSDYSGFAGVSATFKIVVGAHQLAFQQEKTVVNATNGTAFFYQVQLSDLLLDRAPITSANLSSAVANTTGSWLSFDASKYTLSGTPTAEDPQDTRVAISFTDVFGDVASTDVDVLLNSTSATSNTNTTTTRTNSSTTLIHGGLPANFNVTPGTFFSFTFNSSVVPDTAVLNITIAGAPWLHYNSANRTLYGEVPLTSGSKARKRQSASTGAVTVTVSDGTQSQTQTIGINVNNPTSATTTSTTSPSTASATTSALPSATHTSTPAAKGKSHGLTSGQKLGIGLGVSLPILFIILALAIFCCCRSRKARSIRSVASSNISRPVEREKDEWPQGPGEAIHDDPRQLDAFQMFKSNSSGRLSGYAVEVNHSGMLAPPLATLAHELPPLPESPGFEAVRSAYGSDEGLSRSSLDPVSTDTHISRGTPEMRYMANTGPNLQNPSIKAVVTARRSVQEQGGIRDSTQTMDSVSTEEIFSVRLLGDTQGPDLAPALTRPTGFASRIGKQVSAQTIGTYTSSEGDYIRRYGSNGESLSSGAQSRQQLSQISRNTSNQAQPWRVMPSEDSYGSFGSYATTDSSLSDEFSFDGSLSGDSSAQRRYSDERDEASGSEVIESGSNSDSLAPALRPRSAAVLMEVPPTPDWASMSLQQTPVRRPTLVERVASFGKGRLMESTARRPMSSASIDSPDISADTETSAEIAFI